jgi:TRAP-type C4-dicarboxylate transport system substrate-binding protein
VAGHLRLTATMLIIMVPAMATADPIKLKLPFFTSDRSNVYQYQARPFVDAVNSEGSGLIEIDVDFSSAVAKVQTQQPQLVADGAADIAIIVPGQTPEGVKLQNKFSARSPE